MKTFLQRIALTTITALLFSLYFPIANDVIAANNSHQEGTGIVESESQTNVATKVLNPTGIIEVESLRTENSKHFSLPDGSYQMFLYSEPIHQLSASGNWQDIDNSLVSQQRGGTQVFSTSDNRVRFSQEIGSDGSLWSLVENGYSVTLGISPKQLLATSKSDHPTTVKVLNPQKRSTAHVYNSIEEAAQWQTTSKIVYENIIPNTDLEYIVGTTSIKENIIVKQKSQTYSYVFTLNTKGLFAEIDSAGCITLYDSASKEAKYALPAPFMYDAANTVSVDVRYQLEKVGDTYQLTVIPSEEWINSADRAFPIVIDPTLAPVYATEDSYVDTNLPHDNYGNSSMLWLRSNRTSYIKFSDIPLPNNAIVNYANLEAHFYYLNQISTGGVSARAYQALSNWFEDDITAATYVPTPDTHLDQKYLSAEVNAYASSPGTVHFNITSAVNAWRSGSGNYGIVLKYFNGPNLSVILCSSESGTNKPSLNINYSTSIPSTVSNGVYWLKNTNNNLYADTTGGGVSADTELQQYGKTNGNIRNQMFKIAYVSTSQEGRHYTIRPMTNSSMVITTSGTGVSGSVSLFNNHLSEATSSFSDSLLWTITPSGEGYAIKNKAYTNGYLTAPSNSTNGDELFTTGNITDQSRWVLEEYTGPELNGCGARRSSNSNALLSPGETITLNYDDSYTFHGFMYSTVIGRNGPVTYSVSNPDNAQVLRGKITQNGLFTPLSSGTVRVTISYESNSSPIYYDINLPATRTSSLILHYDQSYIDRYPNATSRITAESTVLKEVYYRNFGLVVNYSVPTQIGSVSDACSKGYGTGICCPGYSCSNHSHDGTHHRDIAYVTSNFRNYIDPQISNETTIIFIGHNFCYESNNMHYYAISESDQDNYSDLNESFLNLNYFGLYYRDAETGEPLYGCVFNRLATDTYTTPENRTFIHEFGHWLGAIDHYAEDLSHATDSCKTTAQMNTEYTSQGVTFEDNCIYGCYKNNINDLTGNIFCEGCRYLISQGIAGLPAEDPLLE